MTKRAFVSHVNEEAAVAARLKSALTSDFLQMLDVFVSSDGESISAGDDWLTSMNKGKQTGQGKQTRENKRVRENKRGKTNGSRKTNGQNYLTNRSDPFLYMTRFSTRFLYT